MGNIKSIIVTGIPRSGTTLICALLNCLDNTICLREPQQHVDWLKNSPSAIEYSNLIVEDFKNIRADLIENRPVYNRVSRNGLPLTNYFPDRDNAIDKRAVVFDLKKVNTSLLTEGFLLATKHNVEYSSVLPELINSKYFKFLCPIRNPISTILSWNTLLTPVSKGNIPMSKYFWSEVNEKTKNISNLLLRQVIVFDMFCKRFYEFRRKINVIKYEDLINNQSLVSNIVKRKQGSKISIKNNNNSKQYDWNLAPELYKLITKHSNYIQYFYDEHELKSIIS